MLTILSYFRKQMIGLGFNGLIGKRGNHYHYGARGRKWAHNRDDPLFSHPSIPSSKVD